MTVLPCCCKASIAVSSKAIFLLLSPVDKSCLQVLKHAADYQKGADDPEKAEYFVRVEWIDTVPENKALNEVGLFGNQNTVCQPTTPKWRHTVDRLKSYFQKWETQVEPINPQ